MGYPASAKVQLFQVGYTTGSVNSKVSLIDVTAIFVSLNGNRSIKPLYAANLEIRHDPNSKIARRICELIDDLGLEVFQHAIPPVQDRHLCARGSRDVRKLHRNISATDEHDTRRHRSQFQKIVTRHHQMFALKTEWSRARSGGNYDILGAHQCVVVNHDLGRRHELTGAMEHLDAGFLEIMFC